MSKAKELKKQCGSRYLFQKYLSDRQIARLKTDAPSSFSDTAAATLEAGCVRLDAVLFRSPNGVELVYDVLVRDRPDAFEWICYDILPAKNAKENDMAAALDRYVKEHKLSYTECCFERVNGKVVGQTVTAKANILQKAAFAD